MTARPPDYADIVAAARALAGHHVITPLLGSDSIDAAAGARLLVKAEPLQRTGSFKFRGAFNRIRQIRPAAPGGPGVVAWSSGNHAQGVAAAARLLGLPATIVMPEDAPRAKLAGTRALGARIVTYHRASQAREAIGAAIAEETGAEIVRPYDDRWIIAGQGTVGLEAAAQMRHAGLEPDLALVPCGGGGLIAGTAIALHHHFPGLPIYSVEPAGFDDTARSLKAGRRQANQAEARSICDALLAPEPGALTFAVNSRLLSGGVSVTDDQVRSAMAHALRELKLVLEPGGAVALAAALAGKVPIAGKTVLVIASGGNVDGEILAQALR